MINDGMNILELGCPSRCRPGYSRIRSAIATSCVAVLIGCTNLSGTCFDPVSFSSNIGRMLLMVILMYVGAPANLWWLSCGIVTGFHGKCGVSCRWRLRLRASSPILLLDAGRSSANFLNPTFFVALNCLRVALITAIHGHCSAAFCGVSW